MHIYIGFITAGILIVAGMLFVNSKHVASLALPTPEHATILFGGDMLFDRTIRTSMREKGSDYIFECLDPIFSKQDIVVANLEGPITSNPSISENSRMGDGRNFTFTFPTTTATLLYDHNVRLVNLGNNHIMNFGAAGVASTKNILQKAGVAYFGDPIEQNATVEDIHGLKIAFINYNQFWYKSTASTTKSQIRSAIAQGDVPVVFTHWGEEYLPATQHEKELAHEFVDEGAVLVIGTHPHVVQEHEIYKGKNIYYSLGNLIFDQYFDEMVNHGLMVQATFSKDGSVQVVEIPVVLQKNRQTCPLK